MKTHGPNSPQTIRGTRERRTMRGVLDTRRESEADLRTVEYVQPFGKGFHLVKNPSGSTAYLVADQTGGRTFAPNASVLSGSHTGHNGEAILGGAPAGKKGGQARTRNPRRRGTPELDTNQYAFAEGSPTLAMLYADGVYVSTRATVSPLAGSPCGCILADSSELVGVGSLIFRAGNDMGVWDVEGEVVYDYTSPAGWRILSPVVYSGGFVYWFEGEDIVDAVTTEFDVRLRKATTDLVTVSTVQTENLTTAEAASDLGGLVDFFLDTSEYTASIAADADGAVVYMGVRPQDENFERLDTWQLQFRFALAGGAPSDRQWSPPEGTLFQSAAVGGTSFVILIPRPDVGPSVKAVMSKTDDATFSMVDLWATSTLANETNNLSVSPNGSTLQVYSPAAYIIRGVSSGAVITTTIEPFNDTPSYPDVMYFFGT